MPRGKRKPCGFDFEIRFADGYRARWFSRIDVKQTDATIANAIRRYLLPVMESIESASSVDAVDPADGRVTGWVTHPPENTSAASPGAREAQPTPEQILSWAARLVRVVCFGDLSRNVDDEVCEPVRRIALEMRDAVNAARAAAPGAPPTPETKDR